MNYEDEVEVELGLLIDPIINRVEEVEENMPHPWTYDRVLLQIWLDSPHADLALREFLTDEYWGEAEEIVRDRGPSGPCCNDFACPCGNTNNFRGF
jgi:hypothetical protein